MSDLAELIFGEKRHFSFRPKKRSTTNLNETRSAPSTPHTVWTIPSNGSVASLNGRREHGSFAIPVNRAPNPFDYSRSPKSSFDSVRAPPTTNQAVPGGLGLDDKRPGLPGLSDSGSNSSTDSLRPVTPAAASAPAASSPLALASVSASASSRLRAPTSHDPHDSKAHSTAADPNFTETLPQRPSTAPAKPVEESFSRQPITSENAYISRRRPSAAAGAGNRHLSPVQEQSEAANWSGLPKHSNNSSAPNLANSSNTNDGITIQMSTSTSISTTPSQIDASARERPWDPPVHTIDYDRTMAASAVPPPYSLEPPPPKTFDDSYLRSSSPGYASRALPSVPLAAAKSAHPKQLTDLPYLNSPPQSPHSVQSVQPVQPVKPPLPTQSVQTIQPMQSMQSIHSMQDDFDFPSPPPADRFSSLPGRRRAESLGDWGKFWAPRRQTISAPMPQPEYVSFLDLQ